MNTSQQRLGAVFEHNFSFLRGVPIALYGVGQYTKMLLETVENFQIVGLMDERMTGQTIYGLPVLSREQVRSMARAVILVANLSVSPVIYHRLCEWADEAEMPIYYLNGLSPAKEDICLGKNPYWTRTAHDLKVSMAEHSVVSFDIFDTLIMRACLHPEDIFYLMASQLPPAFANRFPTIRKQAEHICYRHHSKYFTLDMVYQVLEEQLSVPHELVQQWKQLEIDTEQRCWLPRREMLCLFREAVASKQRVLLVSDMYLGEIWLKKMLQTFGIEGYCHLLVSCDIQKDKYDGSIWPYIRTLYPQESILHIGDNDLVDIERPREYGIDTWKIASARELMQWSGISKNWKTERGGMTAGLYAAKSMNSPFAISKHSGKLVIDSMYDLGYLCFGPLVAAFTCWLWKTAQEQQMEVLLFAARDGYLLKQIYQLIQEINGCKSPKAVYFLTSRRAACVAMLRTEQDIRFVIEHVVNVSSMTVHDLLQHTFGIQAKREDPYINQTIAEIGKPAVTAYILTHYCADILAHAKKERNGYQHYVQSLHLPEKKGFINFVCRGVTQYAVEQILQQKMTGYYFAGEELENIMPDHRRIFAWYGKDKSTHTSRESLLMQYLYGEVVFSAPQGQLLYFAPDGTPVYNARSKSFQPIEECHKGITQYVRDMIHSVPDLLSYDWSLETVDQVFGSMTSPRVILSDVVKKNFILKDDITGKTTTLIR